MIHVQAPDRAGPQGPSPLRLYGGSIGIVNGAYALYRATTGMGEDAMMMDGGAMASMWFMGILGVIVLAHGTALFTPLADRDGFARVSGPLMVTWALLMLANEAWRALGGTLGVTWDAGMIALALLMLASGVIMTRRRPSGGRFARVGA